MVVMVAQKIADRLTMSLERERGGGREKKRGREEEEGKSRGREKRVHAENAHKGKENSLGYNTHLQ